MSEHQTDAVPTLELDPLDRKIMEAFPGKTVRKDLTSLMKRGAYYTVKTASPIESLFGVTRSPDAYLAGSVMMEAAAEAAGESAATDVFLRLLTTLKMLIYSDVGPYSLCLNFVFGLLKSGGFVSPSPADADYDVPPEEQTSLGDSALPRLKKYIRLFENKYVCRIRSAALL